ncbi:MAG: PA0069 family radical SAM protein [Pseudomonadota bacterium]
MTARYSTPGRGYSHNVPGRFAATETVTEPGADLETSAPTTHFHREQARSIVSGNRSPDVPFDWSINSYRGCEHGCVYCFARPSHSYLDLSPGRDFETEIFYKPNGADLLLAHLAKPGYRCQGITLGANTDPYQPAEKRFGLTRALLDVFIDCRHPVSIVTKGTLIERDIDRLTRLAERGLTQVSISLPTLDRGLKRTLEPRVASGERRLKTIRRLADAGIPVTVLVAPIIPAVTCAELERILEAAAAHGASQARYTLLRLPHELEGLFRDWLDTHLTQRADHVFSLLRSIGGGRTYDSRFGHRQRGHGAIATLMGDRFETACRRYGLNAAATKLRTDQFRPPAALGAQRHLPF